MAQRNSRFQLMIAPGILNDGTFGIYAIPEDNPQTEYQLDARYETVEKAKMLAELYRKYFRERLVSEEILIKDGREKAAFNLAQTLEANEIESAISKSLERSLEPLKWFDPRKVLEIAAWTPYFTAWVALVAFYFSISISVPKWFPLLGEYLGGKTFSPRELALILPYILCFLVAYVYLKTRFQAARNSHHKDMLIELAVVHKRTREQLQRMYTRVISTEGHGWIIKLGQKLHQFDSDTLVQIGKNASAQGRGDMYKETFGFVLMADFESRIHALSFMNREENYDDSVMAFDPFIFLIQIGRAKQRLRLLTSSDSQERLLTPLPSDSNCVGIFIYFLSFINHVPLAIALVSSLYIRPLQTVWGWVGAILASLLAAAVGPIWNFKLLLRHRGLPRGWSLLDLTEGRKNKIVAVL